MATKQETVSFRTTPEVKEKLLQMSGEQDVSLSKLLHKIIIEYLKEK